MNILINEDLGCSISQNIPIPLDLTSSDGFKVEVIAYPFSVFPTSQVLLTTLPKPASPRPPSRTPKIAPPPPVPLPKVPKPPIPPSPSPSRPPVKKEFP